jgi:hypothetical protein
MRILGLLPKTEGLRSTKLQPFPIVVWWSTLIVAGLRISLHFPTTDRGPNEWNLQLQSIRVLANPHILIRISLIYVQYIGGFKQVFFASVPRFALASLNLVF